MSIWIRGSRTTMRNWGSGGVAGKLYQQNQNSTSEKTDPKGKLVIENFKKIEKRWFGDWQIGGVIEDKDCYALQTFHKNGRVIIITINRQGFISDNDGDNFEMVYNVTLMDGKSTLKNPDIIEDYIYKSTLEDMEFFGEAITMYLTTYYG